MHTTKVRHRLPVRLVLTVAALALVALAPGLVHSQADMEVLSNEAFENDQRPPAVFNHDEHNALAELEDQCWYCHHMDGDNPNEDEDSIGIPCVDCHMVDAEDGSTPLMLAYHKQCKGCHMREKAGPITCGECHVR